jgi:hypothetical protein
MKKARKIKTKSEIDMSKTTLTKAEIDAAKRVVTKILTPTQERTINLIHAEADEERMSEGDVGIESQFDLNVDSSKPSRKVGWRWRHPKPNGYGILSIEGTLYFVRPVPGSDGPRKKDYLRWVLTKIARNEVTYYVTLWPAANYHESGGVFIGSPNYPSCTCESREEGGCKHAKAILALRQKGSL